MGNRKILIIRFSSIGDIVLTTPVVRVLHQVGSEVHYLTKKNNLSILQYNPYISKVHVLQEDVSLTVKELLDENFDFVIDLHNNIRSHWITCQLHIPCKRVQKANLRKWVYVHLKYNVMKGDHIVDRYFQASEQESDGRGLDFFINEKDTFLKELDHEIVLQGKYVAIACGAQHFTKRIPVEKIFEITSKLNPFRVVLLGDKSDAQRLQEAQLESLSNLLNLCGKTSLQESALWVKNASVVITSDTGLMHIAAAFQRPIIAVWGNTTPSIGFAPYLTPCENFEVDGLSCRPCSKLGFDHCPKHHHLCMKNQDWDGIVASASNYLQ